MAEKFVLELNAEAAKYMIIQLSKLTKKQKIGIFEIITPFHLFCCVAS
jgi:hypothetical protein